MSGTGLVRSILRTPRGKPLDAVRTDELRTATLRVLANRGDSAGALEQALGLAGGWLQALRLDVREEVRWSDLVSDLRSAPVKPTADSLHAELSRFVASGGLQRALDKGDFPQGRNGALMRLFLGTGGIPSVSTLRRWIEDARAQMGGGFEHGQRSESESLDTGRRSA